MKLENEFTVPASLGDTWATLLDIERVAGCLPGASLEAANGGDTHRGSMKIRVGPVQVHYDGSVTVREIDEDRHMATFEARARESGGSGAASAVITNRLEPAGDSTRVIIETSLDITGRQAQFGRGMLQAVSERLIQDFANRLEREIAAGPRGEAADIRVAESSSKPASRPESEHEEATALDLGAAVVIPWAKRAAPFAAAILLVALLLGVVRRRPSASVTFKVRLR